MSDNGSYYRKRAADELAAAERATNAAAADAHRELANRYLRMVGEPSAPATDEQTSRQSA